MRRVWVSNVDALMSLRSLWSPAHVPGWRGDGYDRRAGPWIPPDLRHSHGEATYEGIVERAMPVVLGPGEKRCWQCCRIQPEKKMLKQRDFCAGPAWLLFCGRRCLWRYHCERKAEYRRQGYVNYFRGLLRRHFREFLGG